MFSNHAPEHRLVFDDEGIQAERARLGDLLAAESKQLVRQLGAARAGSADLSQSFIQRMAVLDLSENQIAVAVDDHKHGVEILADASRQPAHAIPFLRLDELL